MRTNCHLELWEVRTHEKAFEKVFGRKLTTRVLQQIAADVPRAEGACRDSS